MEFVKVPGRLAESTGKVAPPFEIGRYPVTNGEYQQFLEATGYHPPPAHLETGFPSPEDHYPVVYISLFDALAFCEWARCRLPTLEEWRWATFGPEGHTWPWGEKAEPGRANTRVRNEARGQTGTTPVGSYPLGASPFGLLDTIGNVWEWNATVREQNGERWYHRVGSAWDHFAWQTTVLDLGDYRSWSSGVRVVRNVRRLSPCT